MRVNLSCLFYWPLLLPVAFHPAEYTVYHIIPLPHQRVIAAFIQMQRMRFATVDAARAAYFARLEDLAQKGYLDATAD